jgi:hypothetical protein
LLFIVSGASFISKKNQRTRILKKSSPKNIPLGSGIRDPGPGKNSSQIRIPGVKKHRIPDLGSGSATLLPKSVDRLPYFYPK